MDGIHAEMATRRALLKDCGFDVNKTSSEDENFVRQVNVFLVSFRLVCLTSKWQGCVLDAKELEARRKESLAMAALLRKAGNCVSLTCVLQVRP